MLLTTELPSRLCGQKKDKKKKKKASTDPSAGPARKNGEGDFKGKRLELLQQHLVDYPRVASMKRGKHKYQRDATHWQALDKKYWHDFPWRLPLNEEPPSDDEELEPLRALPAEEEEEKMAQVINATRQKYRWWIGRQERGVKSAKTPFAPWLDQLRQQVGPPPRRIADHQFYIQHPNHKLDVLAELNTRHPDTTRKTRLKLLNRLGQQMLDGRSTTLARRGAFWLQIPLPVRSFSFYSISSLFTYRPSSSCNSKIQFAFHLPPNTDKPQPASAPAFALHLYLPHSPFVGVNAVSALTHVPDKSRIKSNDFCISNGVSSTEVGNTNQKHAPLEFYAPFPILRRLDSAAKQSQRVVRVVFKLIQQRNDDGRELISSTSQAY
uniref:Uncharacterized protein n=1 Tax=Mycena chlorophos TaxID=658473 RepID=A0ABQ0L714_MYCCL|nr:predicted protein [Mycena chlorophos]